MNIGFNVISGWARFESVKRACSGNSICSHVFKVEPFTHFQLWQQNVLSNTIHGIASGAKYGASEEIITIVEVQYNGLG